ncbi:HGGxSTG domain-containing protein [Erythrobacter oryzae]|uniref:HGGxSTG domain-containing protein n=1 Tax=Erythrobacter oryzae TaxID=3019556 RepID=UPI003AF32F7D
MANQTNNPMQPERLAKAPRCLARTRSGNPCQSPAVKGKARCRMHGGKGSGAPRGNRNAYKHGSRSAEARRLQDLIRMMRGNLEF